MGMYCFQYHKMLVGSGKTLQLSAQSAAVLETAKTKLPQ
jgi:hypothetical protein